MVKNKGKTEAKYKVRSDYGLNYGGYGLPVVSHREMLQLSCAAYE